MFRAPAAPKGLAPSVVGLFSKSVVIESVPSFTKMLPVKVLMPTSVTVPAPPVVTPPDPLITLPMRRLSVAVSARRTSSATPAANVPPLICALPPPVFRMPAFVSVSVCAAAAPMFRTKFEPATFSVLIARVVCPLIDPVTCTCCPPSAPIVAPAPAVAAPASVP